MAKLGVADYGIYVWDGGFYDYEDRIAMISEIGYEGLERLSPNNSTEALFRASQLIKKNMSFATCEAPNMELSIKWTAALGGSYVWAEVQGYTFDALCRQVDRLSEICEKYGIYAAVHNHLGSFVESQEQVEEVLTRCPKAKLLLDTGHLAVAGGDVLHITQKYYDRIIAFHLKGWQTSDTPDAAKWQDRGHFCGLAQGDFPIDNEGVVKTIVEKGFDGWVFLEHDTHKRDPKFDLKESYDLLKKWGL